MKHECAHAATLGFAGEDKHAETLLTNGWPCYMVSVLKCIHSHVLLSTGCWLLCRWSVAAET